MRLRTRLNLVVACLSAAFVIVLIAAEIQGMRESVREETEAANRVTDFALVELGWPHLWLNNAEDNIASHRVKEKQGATIIDRTTRGYVYGQGVKVTWLLTREAWLAHRQTTTG